MLTTKLSAIADAIRAKTGKADALTIDQMPGEIASIQGGGGSNPDESNANIIQRGTATSGFNMGFETSAVGN